jgi:cysteine desulfurase family protein
MRQYIEDIGVNVGRGAYAEAYDAQRVVLDTREKLAHLFGAASPSDVIFTKNVTESLNLLLKGLLSPGDHIITSSVEHNAVMRPLTSLEKKGVEVTRVLVDQQGNLDLQDFFKCIKTNTKAVIMTHASNVSGTVLDLAPVGSFCRSNGIWMLVDAAQTAGLIPVSLETLKADAICFTGHKGLLGPQGIGGIAFRRALADVVDPLIEGGTGSASESEVQPMMMPDKFEAGTPNLPGIYGLHRALEYLEEIGIETIHQHEIMLVERFWDALHAAPGIRWVGRQDVQWRTGVVSLDFEHSDNAEVAAELEQTYAISTRVGMHCAPAAHKALGTFPKGTVRFSFSGFTTEKEVDTAVNAILEIVRHIEG